MPSIYRKLHTTSCHHLPKYLSTGRYRLLFFTKYRLVVANSIVAMKKNPTIRANKMLIVTSHSRINRRTSERIKVITIPSMKNREIF